MRQRLAADGAAYTALSRQLRAGVHQNRYAEGERLPTEEELAARHGLSRQTVRRAFQDLVAEGTVYRVRGRGTFVTPREGQYLRQFGSVEDLMGLSIDTRLELTSPLQRRVDVVAAGRLRTASDLVATAVFRRLHHGLPISVTTTHLPVPVADLLADVPELTVVGERSTATVIGLLETRLTHPISEAEQSITATAADARQAEALGVDEGTPLLRVDRLYVDSRQEPVELAVSHFHPEHYSYRVRLKRSVS
ncbi:MAG TPA: GntR family transcriptional regulator [Mycobacteriales bacterium]|jgi:DNA-binding GntR family transcriptional regulator|nr:GntR family transcriptional regulator [Mycobacteriales bacterium]